jgi:hypothetical protein
MLAAVDFDHEPSLQTCEIDDVASDRNLTAEAVALELLSAQAVPEVDFSIGHLTSQLSGTPDIGGRGGMHGNHPERRPPP